MENIEAVYHEDFTAIIRPGVTREGLNQVNYNIYWQASRISKCVICENETADFGIFERNSFF